MTNAPLGRFKPGDRVRVRVDNPPRHVRTPAYIQGKTGWVERNHGEFKNPESLAHGGDGRPKRPLYLVRFGQSQIWPNYPGPVRDQVFVDIYEHWLEPA